MGKLFNRRKSDDKALSPTALMDIARSTDDENLDAELTIPPMPQDEPIPQDETMLQDEDLQTSLEIDQEKTTHRAPNAHTTPSQDAAIFTFIGASGGVGTTSLATQIAYELASRQKQQSPMHRPVSAQVCLIDLDFETGATAHHLDVSPSLNIDDLTGDAGRIDAAFTSALISTHSSGVSLLASPNIPGATRRINPMAVLAMLDAAAKLYQYVIVDMPRHEQPWSLPVMAGSDYVGMVTELTIPALHLARMQMDKAQDRLGGRQSVEAIVSKFERRSLRKSLRLVDAEKALKRKVWATVCADPDTAREALNCGEPVGAVRPDSRLAKDSRRLVDKLELIAEELRIDAACQAAA